MGHGQPHVVARLTCTRSDVHLPDHAACRVAAFASALALLLAVANGQAEAPAAAPETSAAAGEAAQPAHGNRQLP